MKMNISKMTMTELAEMAKDFNLSLESIARNVNGTFAQI